MRLTDDEQRRRAEAADERRYEDAKRRAAVLGERVTFQDDDGVWWEVFPDGFTDMLPRQSELDDDDYQGEWGS